MIRFQCPACNKTLQTPPETAGKLVACPCGEKMRVPIPMAATVEEPSPAFSSNDDFGANGGLGASNNFAASGQPDDIWNEPLTPYTPPAPGAYMGATANPSAPGQFANSGTFQPPQQTTKASGGAFGTEKSILNSGTVGGALAMLAAIVWFFGGLFFGIIFFYPPILFIIGLIGFIKGLVSRE